jgi:hypothetical protein
MTSVVCTYKECLKYLQEMQDGDQAAYKQVAIKCNKLLQETDHPPEATWNRLVLDMQASVLHVVIAFFVTPNFCSFTPSAFVLGGCAAAVRAC